MFNPPTLCLDAVLFNFFQVSDSFGNSLDFSSRRSAYRCLPETIDIISGLAGLPAQQA